MTDNKDYDDPVPGQTAVAEPPAPPAAATPPASPELPALVPQAGQEPPATEPRKGPPSSIPYHRFKERTEQYHQAKAEADEWKNRYLKEVEVARQKPAEPAATPESTLEQFNQNPDQVIAQRARQAVEQEIQTLRGRVDEAESHARQARDERVVDALRSRYSDYGELESRMKELATSGMFDLDSPTLYEDMYKYAKGERVIATPPEGTRPPVVERSTRTASRGGLTPEVAASMPLDRLEAAIGYGER